MIKQQHYRTKHIMYQVNTLKGMNNMDKNEVVNDIQEGTEEPVKQYPPATAKEQ